MNFGLWLKYARVAFNSISVTAGRKGQKHEEKTPLLFFLCIFKGKSQQRGRERSALQGVRVKGGSECLFKPAESCKANLLSAWCFHTKHRPNQGENDPPCCAGWLSQQPPSSQTGFIYQNKDSSVALTGRCVEFSCLSRPDVMFSFRWDLLWWQVFTRKTHQNWKPRHGLVGDPPDVVHGLIFLKKQTKHVQQSIFTCNCYFF